MGAERSAVEEKMKWVTLQKHQKQTETPKPVQPFARNLIFFGVSICSKDSKPHATGELASFLLPMSHFIETFNESAGQIGIPP
jgi:hypothetical protein